MRGEHLPLPHHQRRADPFYGLSYTYSAHRPILDRVYALNVRDLQSGEYLPVSRDESKLYSVAVSWTTLQSLSLITDNSFGLLRVMPKDQNGNALDTLEKQRAQIVFHSLGKETPTELKEWYALYRYIAKQPKGARGLPLLSAERFAEPPVYMVNSNASFFTLFHNPGRMAYAMLLLVCILLVMLALCLLLFLRHKKNKHRKACENKVQK